MRIFAKIAMCTLTAVLFAVNCRGVSLNHAQENMAGFDEIADSFGEVTIALIDTGVTAKRLDQEKILPGRNYVSAEERDTTDLVGHGTKIASLILGAADGEDYITALAPNARIVPLVYYSQYPSGVAKNGGVEAICQAVYDGVDEFSAGIIVISSGIGEDDPNLAECIAYAEKRGVIVISAAGNDGGDALLYPAAYPTVISVGSVDGEGRVSRFSQKNDTVTIAAPGEHLFAVSLRNGDFFENCSGTSYSCAYVAALAARLLGESPHMSPEDFRRVLEISSKDIVSAEGTYSYGILHGSAAMAMYREEVLPGTVCSQRPATMPHTTLVHQNRHFLTVW